MKLLTSKTCSLCYFFARNLQVPCYSRSFCKHAIGSDIMGDRALPNEKWSKESVALFKKFSEMGSDWKKLYWDMSVAADGSKAFSSAVPEPGKFLEYAFFNNAKLQHLKGVVQFGPYTRGPVGFVHGGAIATVHDGIMANCILHSGYRSVTANLNIDYIRPIPLNSTTLVEAKIDKIEGRKIFASGEIKTVDGSNIYSKATSMFVMSKLNASL